MLTWENGLDRSCLYNRCSSLKQFFVVLTLVILGFSQPAWAATEIRVNLMPDYLGAWYLLADSVTKEDGVIKAWIVMRPTPRQEGDLARFRSQIAEHWLEPKRSLVLASVAEQKLLFVFTPDDQYYTLAIMAFDENGSLIARSVCDRASAPIDYVVPGSGLARVLRDARIWLNADSKKKAWIIRQLEKSESAIL